MRHDEKYALYNKKVIYLGGCKNAGFNVFFSLDLERAERRQLPGDDRMETNYLQLLGSIRRMRQQLHLAATEYFETTSFLFRCGMKPVVF